ncbi:MAG: TonB-dependent receptor [Candidatus Solibacter usitatus]|nr:TonB-dependent receptor [Candidatus Solibacter usitatus]
MTHHVVFVLFLALFGQTVFAQSKTSATLTGTVTDPTDAVIQGARIIVTNAETGATRESLSDDRGDYLFPLLPAGTYEVRVEKQGFGSRSAKGVAFTVGQSASIDFKLEVGESSQLIEVQADTPLVEAERTQQSNTLTEQFVRNLPINRRDYLSFALLAPGVSDSSGLADSNSFRVKQTPDSGLSFYGSNGRGNNVSVDGGESNDAGGGVRATVSQEAVQEFQVNRTNYSAEHGQARGGVINIVTKGGGNAVRGSLFSFFRHDGLDATNPFSYVLGSGNRVSRVKPDSSRQQFGATAGGPIAKDKTFFFLAYEQLRRRENSTVVVLTDQSIFQATPAQEAILSQLPAAAAAGLRAALVSPPETVEMFRSNSGIFPFQTDQYQGLARLDHRFSDRNLLSFRFNSTKSYDTNQNLAALVGVSRGFVSEGFDNTGVLNWTYSLTPSVINEARAQFNHSNPRVGTNDPFGPALEIAGFGFFNRDRFLPSITITRRADLSEAVSWVHGTHTLKAGVQVLIRNNHSDSKTFMSGRFTFGALPGGLVNAALASTTITALQAFNLGLAQSYQQGFGDPVVRATYPLYAGYLQDTWRPRPNFTLNLGLRYEVDHRKSPLPTDKKGIGPRIGFSWDPFNSHKTAIRGGYGMYQSVIDFQIDYVVNALGEINGYRQIAQVLTTLNAANPLAANGPINIFRTLLGQKIIGVPTPRRSIQSGDLTQFGINISQTGPRPPLTVLFETDPNYRNPYAHQASFGIDREIAKNLSLSVSYVFVRGVHLTTSRDSNLLPAPVNAARGIRDWGVTADNPTGARYFGNPLLFQNNVYESGANSWYNGFMLEVNRRFSNRATVAFNYTLSKAIDETVDYNSDFQPNDQTCRACERSLSSFDQRHKVVLYALLQTPSKGFFGDWIFTPIFKYNSPRPFNLLAGTEVNNDRHNTTDRPVFAGRNIGIGPNYWTFDTRLSKRFAFAEKKHLEFLFETFNLFNRLNYSSVNNTVGAAIPTSFTGRDDRTPSQPLGYTSAADPRRIQLGLRLSF